MLLRFTCRSLLAAGTLVVAAIAPLAAQSGEFEGVITMKMTGSQAGEGTMGYSIRHGAVRMDISGPMGKVAMIVDPKAAKMYMVIPAQQVYMERPLDMAAIEQPPNTAKPEITKTGRTETVAGHQCEHWIIKDANGEADACIAKGLGAFMLGQSGMGNRQAQPAWYEEFRKGGYFPLKMSAVGGPVTLEVTSIEKKALDPALFAPPAGFRKMDMPGMMGPRRP